MPQGTGLQGGVCSGTHGGAGSSGIHGRSGSLGGQGRSGDSGLRVLRTVAGLSEDGGGHSGLRTETVLGRDGWSEHFDGYVEGPGQG